MHRSDRRRSISADIPIIGFDRRSQNGRSDDVTSARTIRRFNRCAPQRRRCARRGPQSERSTRGSSPPSAAPSPELNLWVNSPTLACLSPYRLMLTVHTFDRELTMN
ncbi:hypothetical protein EYF80_038900 [Liparis tanakae]|uniref:Uncharacterized protein n=1 Tax=Liparis tanakae TaxID=230148 RepID=A0A4Z2GBA9_9TELE|nr:hypothetical protein EYF80_038900 [Liparis tanakae]